MRPSVLVDLAKSAAKVTVRRVTGADTNGDHPPRSLGFEILVQGLREAMVLASGMSVRDRREFFETLATPAIARDIRHERTSADGVPATWFTPKSVETNGNASERAVILFFHGGAYQFGSVHIYTDWLNRLARDSGRRVLAIDYRLAPEHPFPAAREDALRAYSFLTRQGFEVSIAGDSAGGNLTVTTLLAIRDGEAGKEAPMPKRAVLVCPWLDLAFARPSRTTNDGLDTIPHGAADSWATAYLAGHDPHDPRISPIYADLKGLPPLLIQGGTHEVLHDEIVDFDAKARAAGVDVTLSMYEGMVHDFHVLAAFGIAPARDAIREMGRFLGGA